MSTGNRTNHRKGIAHEWYKHGGAIGDKRPIYNAWRDMRRRCNNPNYRTYKWYGRRGIKVCDRWDDPLEGFPNFLADLGYKPSPQHSLDRIDNNGDYSPENCRWTTQKMQSRNMSRNRLVTIDGRTECVTDWCLEYGADPKVVWTRIGRGWNEIEAITTPLKFHRS